MSQSFYHAFEQAFRGSREEIGTRLHQAYGPFLKVMADEEPEAKVLDLGCGRGEWLELAQSYGFAAHGVDLDEGMLADCLARGLSVTHGDAIAYLSGEPDGSLAVVSGFHIAEHLPFSVLQQVFQESLRALRPGGLLILETPNAENIHVSGLSFHMDPTHNKPLPPGLVSFLARHYGFARAEILRLQENADLRGSYSARLLDVISGVSPDYALVAQKAGPASVLTAASLVFDVDRGLTLDTLADRFEQTIERRSVATAKRELHEPLNDLSARQLEHERQLRELISRQTEQERRLEEQSAELLAVYQSTSWRLSRPVRVAGKLARQGKSAFRPALRRFFELAIRVPGIRRLGGKIKQLFPGAYTRAKRLILGTFPDGHSTGLAYHQSLDRQLLSPRATSIYIRLTEQQKKLKS